MNSFSLCLDLKKDWWAALRLAHTTGLAMQDHVGGFMEKAIPQSVDIGERVNC